MKVLGLDPSLTNYGWAVLDASKSVGDRSRCVCRGRFQTSARTMYVSRYLDLRDRLRDLIVEVRPDKIGLEFPVFNDLWSEGMYGLFLYTSEALYHEKQDVVFWSPMQVKAHAREFLGRPSSWKMMKPDMVEAAKVDSGGGRWNHNEADAYLVAKLASRFWLFQEKQLETGGLTHTETKMFTEIKIFIRGKRAGQTLKRGVLYREDERFFLWSKKES